MYKEQQQQQQIKKHNNNNSVMVWVQWTVNLHTQICRLNVYELEKYCDRSPFSIVRHRRNNVKKDG